MAGVEVTYQAPDRVSQVELGEVASASASSGGTAGTLAPSPATITKLFIGDRYYEDDATGPAGPFSVSARCADDSNAAEFVLGILRAIAVSQDIHVVGSAYRFTVPKGDGVPFPLTGTATLASGVVSTISASPSPVTRPVLTIGAVNRAPPVTAPSSAMPVERTCGSTGTGGAATGSGTAPAVAGR